MQKLIIQFPSSFNDHCSQLHVQEVREHKIFELREYFGMTKSLSISLHVFCILIFLSRHLVLVLVKEIKLVEVKSMGYLVLA